MDDLSGTKSGFAPEWITTNVKTYSANSVTDAGGIGHTYCKRETGVRPPRSNVWWWTPTSTLAVGSDISNDERDEPSEGSDEGKGGLHFQKPSRRLVYLLGEKCMWPFR